VERKPGGCFPGDRAGSAAIDTNTLLEIETGV